MCNQTFVSYTTLIGNIGEINLRIAKRSGMARRLNQILRLTQLSRLSNIRLYEKVLSSTVLYGSVPSVMKWKTQNDLEIWKINILNRMFDSKKARKERRKSGTNEELCEVSN